MQIKTTTGQSSWHGGYIVTLLSTSDLPDRQSRKAHGLAWRLFSASEVLLGAVRRLPIEQPFVLIMRSDPDPQKPVGHIHSNSSIAAISYSHRINVTYLLKAQRRNTRIFFPQPVCASRRCLTDSGNSR